MLTVFRLEPWTQIGQFYQEALRFSQPILIAGVLKYFHGLISLNQALIYASMISGFVILASILHHPYFFNVVKLGVKLRIACSGLIYKKVCSGVLTLLAHLIRTDWMKLFIFIQVLRLNLSCIENQAGGQVLNLISNDAARIEVSPYFVAFLVIGPVLAIGSLVVLSEVVHSTFLFGFVLILIILVIQVILAKIYDYFR